MAFLANAPYSQKHRFAILIHEHNRCYDCRERYEEHRPSQFTVGHVASKSAPTRGKWKKDVANFKWTDDLSAGNAMIDNDHKDLIILVNKLDEALHSGKGHCVLGDILDELINYTALHFGREERLMQQIKYPEFARHKNEHDALLSDVAKIQRSFKSGELNLSTRAYAFLCEWLGRHIRTSDRLLGSVAGSLQIN